MFLSIGPKYGNELTPKADYQKWRRDREAAERSRIP